MNRAILIVICDFLVSSMLAMMTGMVPAHTGGTGVGLDESTTKSLLAQLEKSHQELEKAREKLRETIAAAGQMTPEQQAELQRLTRMIVAGIIQENKLREHLAATPENTGKLTPQELQKKLDEELRRRMETEMLLKDRNRDLSSAKEQLADTKQRLNDNAREISAQRHELSKVRDALGKTSDALIEMSKNNVESREKLARTETELASTQTKVAEQERSLHDTRQELVKINTRLGETRNEYQRLQQTLANTSGQLLVRERDLAAVQDRLDRSERNLRVAQLEIGENKLMVNEMQRALKTAVKELSSVREEKTKEQIARTKAETRLEAVNKMLIEADKKVSETGGSDVFAGYRDAVVTLSVEVKEKALLGEVGGKTDFHLPVVKFGDKTFIVGNICQLAGDKEKALHFAKITTLIYRSIAPAEKAQEQQIHGPMLLCARNNRLAALPYRSTDRKALTVITAEQLQKRGLHGLYLFKSSSLGKESAELNNRCSMSIEQNQNILFIRNAGRANNELRAEPGDFVITMRGELVGVAMENDSIDKGRVKGVKVLLFNNEQTVWENAVQVSLGKGREDAFYTKFGEAMRELRKTIPPER